MRFKYYPLENTVKHLESGVVCRFFIDKADGSWNGRFAEPHKIPHHWHAIIPGTRPPTLGTVFMLQKMTSFFRARRAEEDLAKKIAGQKIKLYQRGFTNGDKGNGGNS
jgi:hypothetical protein